MEMIKVNVTGRGDIIHTFKEYIIGDEILYGDVKYIVTGIENLRSLFNGHVMGSYGYLVKEKEDEIKIQV